VIVEEGGILLGVEYSESVEKCGEYYLVRPLRNIMDAPSVVVDSNANEIAQCGGFPSSLPLPEPPECQVECEKENLCNGIEIDCSIFQFKNTEEDKYYGVTEEWYDNMGDDCYVENLFRMNDTKYCDMITDEYRKENCPFWIL